MDLEQQIRNQKVARAQNIHDAFITKAIIDPNKVAENKARRQLKTNPDKITKAEAIAILTTIDNDELIKGKPGAEGEIREWGGKKYKKTGKEWKEVGKGTDGKKKDDDKKTKSKDKPDPSAKGQPDKLPTEAPDKHEVAQLTHLKSVLENDTDKAYEIYQALSPEAQAVVPQELVNQMVKYSHTEVDSDAKKVFDDGDPGNPEEKDNKSKLYNDIRQWVGDEYDDESINSVIEGFVEAGYSQKNLEVTAPNSSYGAYLNALGERVDKLAQKVVDNQKTPMDSREVAEILDGLIRSEFKVDDWDNQSPKEIGHRDDDSPENVQKEVDRHMKEGPGGSGGALKKKDIDQIWDDYNSSRISKEYRQPKLADKVVSGIKERQTADKKTSVEGMVSAIDKLSDEDKKDMMYEFGENYDNGGQRMSKEGADKLVELGVLSQDYAQGHGYVYKRTNHGRTAITQIKKQMKADEKKKNKVKKSLDTLLN